MALSAKLELRQSQQLVMTPQLQQAIKLLQLSNIELSAFVDTELERNPLLERDEDSADDLPRATNDEEAPAANGHADGLDLSLQTGKATVELDADYENVFPETTVADLGPDLAGNSWASLRQHNHSGDGDANLEA